jgi:hypothetical protein
MRTPFQPPANPGAAATAVLLDTGAVEGLGRGKITSEHRARGVVYADQVVTVRHVWYGPGSASGRVLATQATTAGVATSYDFALYAGRNVIEAVTTVAPVAWEVSTEVSDQAGAGSGGGGGGGLSGVTADSVVFGAADGSGTWSDDFKFDPVLKKVLLRNQTNTAGQNASYDAQVEGSGGGNPSLGLIVKGLKTYRWEIDNADSDRLKLKEDGSTRLQFFGDSICGDTTTPRLILSDVSGSLLKYGNNETFVGLTFAGTTVSNGFAYVSGTINWCNFGINAFGFGGGTGIFAIRDAGVIPTTNPTASVLVYSDTGALRIRHPNGGIHTLSAASTSALATTATTGHAVVPHCAGVPTGVPADINGLAMIYDTTNDDLYIYDGAWNIH